MDAIITAEHYIASNPGATDAGVLRALLEALQDGNPFDLQRLYELNLSSFDLAVEVLNAWRLQRYYRGGALVAGAVSSGH